MILHELSDSQIQGHLNLARRSCENMRWDPFLCRDVRKEITYLEDELKRRHPGIPFPTVWP